MAASRTRIRVPRTTLLQAMRERLAQLANEHEKAVEKFERDTAAFLTKLVKGCEDYLALAERDPEEALERCDGRYSSSRNKDYGVLLHIPKLVKPTMPSQGKAERQIGRLIKILEASEDEYISVAPDDEYAEFLT